MTELEEFDDDKLIDEISERFELPDNWLEGVLDDEELDLVENLICTAIDAKLISAIDYAEVYRKVKKK